MITLTTDFDSDYYVAQMKGVIYQINPEAIVVDVKHDVSRHCIQAGAFILSQMPEYFPQGTVHVGIIDPLVGTKRKPIIAQTKDCTFVGPDNGLFTLALTDEKEQKFFKIIPEKLKAFTKDGIISKTFHGRDIFAPAASLLDSGTIASEISEEIDSIKQLDIAESSVVYIDSFGNVIVNMGASYSVGEKISIESDGHKLVAMAANTFADVEEGELAVLTGSHGFLEIAANKEDASKILGVKIGDIIEVD